MANVETGTGASRVMFINSADATQHANNNFLTTDYIFIPDESIVVPPHHNILMSIHHVQIPYSFYNFQEGRNNKLDYGLTANGVTSNATTGTITIPEGNYNAATLMRKIGQLISAEANVGTLTIRFNRDTLKYEWNWVPLVNFERLTLRISSGTNALTNFRDEIGFNDNKFYQGSGIYDVFFDNIFSVVDMNAAIRSLYIRTNLTTSSVLDSAVGGGFSSILGRVAIDVGSGGVITISPTDGAVHKLYIKVREITIIGIRLTDQRNRLIDLQGLDWDISLQFDFIENPELKVPIDKRTAVEVAKYENFQKLKRKDKN